VASLVIIAIATLLPSHGPSQGFRSCIFCGEDSLADAVRNVILFVPLGFTLAHATRHRRAALAFAALFTVCIEITQQWIPGRDPSIGDMLTNTTGAAVGIGLALWQARWARPRGAFALAAGVGAAATFVLTGWLLQPVYPHRTYIGQWTPRFPGMAWYDGKVLDASVGGIEIPSRHVTDSDSLVALLAHGAPVRVRAIAGSHVPRLAPLFSISNVWHHTLLLIGPNAYGLVLRQRLRSRGWGVDSPDLVLQNLSLGQPRDTVTVSVWRPNTSYCIAVSDVSRCQVGFTAGWGWALVWYPNGMPPAVASALTLFWIALLLAPVGFWMDRDWMSVTGVAAAAIGLALAPELTGLLPTPAPEWLAAVAGFAIGATAQHVVRRFAAR